jgi:hypothetical protein
MRRYKKEIKTRYGTQTVLNDGLKQVHIGDDVWVYGRQKYVENPDKSVTYPKKLSHMVIYGPNRKEYHVWGKDVTNLITAEDSDHWDSWSYANRQGNRAIQSKVKIHILTTILDKKENWSFNLKEIPEIGPLKVIYQNGTVKNIEFDGEFKEVEIKKTYGYKCKVKPIAYRIVNKLEDRDIKLKVILF